MTSAKSKRRWISLSLKTLLLLVTIGCIWFGWFVNSARRQRAAVEWVTDLGGKVLYDFEIDSKRLPKNTPSPPPGPAWLREMVGIDYLASVRYVNLDRANVEDISPLRNLVRLERLELSDTNVSNIEPLSKLTRLWLLDLDGTGITDYKALGNLPNLEGLRLNGTPFNDTTQLANLKSLRSLRLDNTSVSDVSPLKNLVRLVSLNLRDTNVSDIEPLKKLVRLRGLGLSNTNVSNIEPLSNLTQLKRLELNSTQVSNLEPLRNLVQLESLELDSTQVSDLTPIENLKNLQNLDLGNNPQIKDVEPLAKLTGPQLLDLKGTGVSESDYRMLQQKLKNTGVRWGTPEQRMLLRRRARMNENREAKVKPTQGAKFKRAVAQSTPGSITMVYDPNTGKVVVKAGDVVKITAWELTSAGSLLLPENATKDATKGPFDSVSASRAFKLAAKEGFTELKYGPILPKGLDFETIRLDMKVRGSLIVRGKPMSLTETTPLLFVSPIRQTDDDGTEVRKGSEELRQPDD